MCSWMRLAFSRIAVSWRLRSRPVARVWKSSIGAQSFRVRAPSLAVECEARERRPYLFAEVWMTAVGAPDTAIVCVALFQVAADVTVMTSPSQYWRYLAPEEFTQITEVPVDADGS